MKLLGAVFVIIGLIGLLWGGVTWTQKEEVVDVGPIEVNRETEESFPVPPVAGAVCLLAGLGLLIASRRA